MFSLKEVSEPRFKPEQIQVEDDYPIITPAVIPEQSQKLCVKKDEIFFCGHPHCMEADEEVCRNCRFHKTYKK